VLVCGIIQLGSQIGVAVVLARLFTTWLSTRPSTTSSAPLAILGLFFGVALLAQLAMTLVLGNLSQQTITRLNAEVLAQVERGIELSGERVGGLAVALTSGLAPLQGYFSKYLPALVQAVFTPLILLAVVVIFDPIAAVVLLLGLVALPLLTARVASRANSSAAKQWRALYALSAHYSELLHGLTTLRLLNATQRARHEVDEATQQYSSATMSALKLAFQSSLVAEFTSGVAVGLTAMVVGFQLLAGRISAASAFTILLVAAEIYAPLRRTSAEFHNAASGRAAAATLFALIDQSPISRLKSVAFDRSTLRLSLQATTVSLPEGHETAPLSLVLSASEVLLVSGASGSGKTTLLNELARSLGDDATLMPQRVDVFSATVENNLVLDGRAVTEADRDGACQATGFDQVITHLPQGFHTMLGDGGVSLSAGERRKLGLTRALLAGRPIVILDEPTANLDEASILHLRDTLPQSLKHRLVILSTHGQTPILSPTATHHLGTSP